MDNYRKSTLIVIKEGRHFHAMAKLTFMTQVSGGNGKLNQNKDVSMVEEQPNATQRCRV